MIYFLARILTQLMTCLIEGESASQITDSTPSRWGSRAKDAVFNAHCLTYIKETLKHQKIIFKGPSINKECKKYTPGNLRRIQGTGREKYSNPSFLNIPSLDNVVYGWPLSNSTKCNG